jgi:hypothetical protein
VSDVDFIAVPTRDRARAAEFYGEIWDLAIHHRYAPYPNGD